jgi:hypothetical protein
MTAFDYSLETLYLDQGATCPSCGALIKITREEIAEKAREAANLMLEMILRAKRRLDDLSPAPAPGDRDPSR